MINIQYVVGDVREPIGTGNKLVCHCVNNLGQMGSGVALALLKKWPEVKGKYIEWFKKDEMQTRLYGKFELGNTQFIMVDNKLKIVVANMIGQHNIITIDKIPPVRYDSLRECLKKVYIIAKKYNATSNFPYLFACDRAGGDWNVVEKMIIEELCEKDISVIIYDIDNLRKIKEIKLNQLM